MIILKSPSALPPKSLPFKAGEIVSYTPPPQSPARPDTDLDEATHGALIQSLHLSFIIYDPLPHLEGELIRIGFTHVLTLDKKWSGTQGICGIRDNKAYIVFRGSASFLDWVYDFLCLPFYWPLCHFGFGTAWRSVRCQVRDWLDQLPAVDETILCGHSLGGGIAHVAALELAPHFKIDSVITFGAPRAFFLGTASKYNATSIQQSGKKLADITHSVVNQRDIVAKVPFTLLGFRDVGQLIYIDQQGSVHTGVQAIRKRSDDSMADIDFVFSFMEEEKMSALGPASSELQKLYYYFRLSLVWLAKTCPPLKTFFLPPLVYVLTSLYFMRSGLAHMGDKYMSAWPQQLWQFRTYQPSKVEKTISLTIRLLLGAGLSAVFFYGFYIVAAWSILSLQPHGQGNIDPK